MTNQTGSFASVQDDGERIAKEIVLIASHPDFDDLRAEMVQRLIMGEFLGHPNEEKQRLLMVAMQTIQNLGAAIEALSDEIAKRSLQIGSGL